MKNIVSNPLMNKSL